MSDAEALARAAERLVGTSFRLYGRDPRTGVDCVGLVAASMRSIGREPPVPEGYRLANRTVDRWTSMAESGGWVEVAGAPEAGDLLMVHPAPTRSHLLIAGTSDNFVHAHAGLRRVVSTPAPITWAIARQWRLADI